jgi:hypothetical protein
MHMVIWVFQVRYLIANVKIRTGGHQQLQALIELRNIEILLVVDFVQFHQRSSPELGATKQ